LGLDNASGEWITFLDADDWLAPNTLETCVPYMTDYDVIRFGIKALYGDGHTYSYHLPDALDKHKALHNVIGGYGFNGIGGFVFRRELVNRHNIRLRTDITYSEDWLFVASLLYHCNSIKVLPEAHLYIYNRYNESSCTNTMTVNKLMQTLKVVAELALLVGEGNYTSELRRARCRRVGMLVKYCGFAEAARELSAFGYAGVITLGDILRADIHLSLRVRLLRLWVGHLRPLRRK
jgi:glycosyltransferase involved in cell wall biosynthesis